LMTRYCDSLGALAASWHTELFLKIYSSTWIVWGRKIFWEEQKSPNYLFAWEIIPPRTLRVLLAVSIAFSAGYLCLQQRSAQGSLKPKAFPFLP